MNKKVINLRNLLTLLGVLLVVFSILIMLSACSGSDNATEDDAAQTNTNTPILDANDWRDQYPQQVSTYLTGKGGTPAHDYLVDYPLLKTIYEGSGFAKSYYSPRPHPNALEDVKKTPRINEKSPSACFACKSPQYAVAESDGSASAGISSAAGSDINTHSFLDVQAEFTHSISCYDCHKNEPGRGKEGRSGTNGGYLGSSRPYFDKAFGSAELDPATESCAQCHNEYHFDPETKAVVVPEGITDPTALYDYYQKISFTDYTRPSTGTDHLKVQHPEFQTYANSYHDQAGMSCADCHLERATGRNGVYTKHDATNPVKSETIRKSVCLPCHGDKVVDLVESVQARTKTQTKAVTERLAAFNVRLARAVSAGRLNDARLSELRALNREAQWYWDWVFVENSYGAHNPTQAKACLDKADALLTQAEQLLP
jgi:nitrite reductase (cytochrome c-552)